MNFYIPSETGETTINVSVYNVYNHNNPFLVYTDYYGWDEATQHSTRKPP